MNIDFIILHGSPGNGKTTLSRKLHEQLQSPYFEFGWIPEFRMRTRSMPISQREEEQLSFENLILVAKNYNAHGYKNVILTDLDDVRMLDISIVLKGFTYVILTLYTDHDEVLKQRILTRDNGNEYTDWQQSIKTNALIRRRPTLPNEYRILNSRDDVDTTLAIIMETLEKHLPDDGGDVSNFKREDFYSYIRDEGI
ncbi:hypothetical protein JCM10914A_01490 [Paenibacillus sp. JCM 10914]|uniref:hypothetical protein n=1 Tax=Paenibacillus sp. JCM 10914 TaxID=1236974 RepID=UPI0003CCB739|nr:hypothetical protein [Paenibacillus sp. JCM 10914]GAE06925.1 hypothetical protein JCM10914_3118 [Paenibacillus sp. JCM 10914]